MKYFTPLFPPGACLHSHSSSKSENSPSVIISPPPLPRQWSQPSVTSQPLSGNVFLLKLRQPSVFLPLNSNFQPPLSSSSVSVLGVRDAPRVDADMKDKARMRPKPSSLPKHFTQLFDARIPRK